MGVLKKKLKRYNIVTGILLAVVAGILHNAVCPSRDAAPSPLPPRRWADRMSGETGGLGAVMSILSTEALTDPFGVVSNVVICLYTMMFGVWILMFELSNR